MRYVWLTYFELGVLRKFRIFASMFNGMHVANTKRNSELERTRWALPIGTSKTLLFLSNFYLELRHGRWPKNYESYTGEILMNIFPAEILSTGEAWALLGEVR